MVSYVHDGQAGSTNTESRKSHTSHINTCTQPQRLHCLRCTLSDVCVHNRLLSYALVQAQLEAHVRQQCETLEAKSLAAKVKGCTTSVRVIRLLALLAKVNADLLEKNKMTSEKLAWLVRKLYPGCFAEMSGTVVAMYVRKRDLKKRLSVLLSSGEVVPNPHPKCVHAAHL